MSRTPESPSELKTPADFGIDAEDVEREHRKIEGELNPTEGEEETHSFSITWKDGVWDLEDNATGADGIEPHSGGGSSASTFLEAWNILNNYKGIKSARIVE